MTAILLDRTRKLLKLNTIGLSYRHYRKIQTISDFEGKHHYSLIHDKDNIFSLLSNHRASMDLGILFTII
jgi:hypothetical protein